MGTESKEEVCAGKGKMERKGQEAGGGGEGLGKVLIGWEFD